MPIKVKVGDETHEVAISDIELEDNQLIIDKATPPSGWFTQEALDAKIKQRLAKEPQKVREALKDDEDFHKEILTKYNVKVNEDGKPVGLDPGFDKNEWIQNKSKEITKPLKDELETFKSKYERTKSNRVKDSILAATKGLFKEEYTKKPEDGIDPIVVSQYGKVYIEDEDGEIVKINKDGDVEIDPTTGKRITPSMDFSNQDKFGDWMIDRRQRGTGFQNGAIVGQLRYSEEQIAKMSEAEYEKHRDNIAKAVGEGRVD